MFTPLQLFLILISFIFIIFAFDAYKRKGMNVLHFLVFFVGLALILLFSFDETWLDRFGAYFGLARGADLLVYMSIVFLAYLYFEMTHRLVKQQSTNTDIIKFQAIQDFWKENEEYDIKLKTKKFQGEKSEYIFLLRAYNEEEVISDTIDKIFEYGFDKIIIVDDGSDDSTSEIIMDKKFHYSDKIIINLRHLINRWWWAANKTGFHFLKTYKNLLDIKYVVTFDADWQMDINDMNKFMKEAPNYDVLLWTRFADGWSSENMPKMRKLILLWSRLVTLAINWLWVTDPHNWYRTIKVDSLAKIKLSSDWMTYASEILESIQRNKLKFKEIPVNIKYTEYTVWKWQKNSNAIKILIELIYKKFFYR